MPFALWRHKIKQQGVRLKRLSIAAAAVLLTFPAFAAHTQEHAHPQGAPTEKLGTVHFATSCSPKVAPQFDRAVALLTRTGLGTQDSGLSSANLLRKFSSYHAA